MTKRAALKPRKTTKKRAAASEPPAPAVRYEDGYRRLADLKPNPKNVRKHPPEQIEQIRALIRKFGWTRPLLIDEDDVLLFGHGAREAGLLENVGEVPVRIVHGLSEPQKRELLIADNQVGANSQWDRQALKLELTDLRSLGGDLNILGFSQEELGRLTFSAKAPGQFAAFDETIPTEHRCPKCGYRWSGGGEPEKDGDESDAGAETETDKTAETT